jgi:hypothetical protein
MTSPRTVTGEAVAELVEKLRGKLPRIRNGNVDFFALALLNDDVASALAGLSAEIEKLKAERDEAYEFRRQHDYCCCGWRMDDHNIGSGHAPVSVYDYHLAQTEERAEAAAAEVVKLKSALFAIAAGCHRAKWTYEETRAPTGAPSPFDFLHRLGDQANEAARAALQQSTAVEGGLDG